MRRMRSVPFGDLPDVMGTRSGMGGGESADITNQFIILYANPGRLYAACPDLCIKLFCAGGEQGNIGPVKIVRFL